MEHWLCLFVHTDIQLQILLPLDRFCSIFDQFTSGFFYLVRNLLSISEQSILQHDVSLLKPLDNTVRTFLVPSGAALIVDIHIQCFFDDAESFKRHGTREQNHGSQFASHSLRIRVNWNTIHCHITFDLISRMRINFNNVW